MGLSLEELKEVTIVSASNKPEQQFLAAVPSYVLTGEEIRRSGAASIPDALRLVPGLMVARNNADTWSISSRGRGFDSIFDNKLLVLVDGRNLSSHFYKDTAWEQVSPLLADVDRIEVIRGPGTSVWGSNAINGIINIITKPASATQGGHLGASLGTLDRGSGEMRYGGKKGDAFYRVSGKYSTAGPLKLQNGDPAGDQFQVGNGSFRIDTDPEGKVRNMVQGGVQSSMSGKTSIIPVLIQRRNLVNDYTGYAFNAFAQFKQTREISPTSTLNWQVWFNHRYDDVASHTASTQIGSAEVQQTFSPFENHSAQWGINLFPSGFVTKAKLPWGPVPSAQDLSIFYSGFLEDSISFHGDKLRIIFGLKAEYLGGCTLELMPSVRALIHPSGNHAFWASVSRAVRRISYEEQHLDYAQSTRAIPGSNAQVLARIGGRGSLVPEAVIAYEAGYRYRGKKDFTLDVAGFYNTYQNLVSGYLAAFQPGLIAPGPLLQVRVQSSNDVSLSTYGVEANAGWKPVDWLRLSGWYAFFMENHISNGSKPDLFAVVYGGGSPRHQFTARASLDLPADFEFDAWLRFVDQLPKVSIPAYTELNLRLGWKPTRHLAVDLIGQNLLHDGHLEAASQLFTDTRRIEIPRSVTLKLAYSF